MAPDWLGRAVTLNDLWNMNKTLIITYSHNPSSAFSDMLWSEVRHVWGNQRTPMGLKGFLSGKVENILKGSLDSIPPPSPSVKIQIMGRKVCLRCKGKTLLGVVNKLLKTRNNLNFH